MLRHRTINYGFSISLTPWKKAIKGDDFGLDFSASDECSMDMGKSMVF